jgi:serine/threonine protein kinase
MAPEILFGKPYMPTSCDLFASAVILFILLAGHPPFAQANHKKDTWYNLIAQEKYD